MPWQQSDIENLEAAIASGVLRVRYHGPPSREVEYQSTDAMLKALSVMRQSVARANGGTTSRVAEFRKGFDQ